MIDTRRYGVHTYYSSGSFYVHRRTVDISNRSSSSSHAVVRHLYVCNSVRPEIGYLHWLGRVLIAVLS